MRVEWSSLEQRRPHEGVRVTAVDGTGFTASRYELAPGARFPRHRHVDEKVLVLAVPRRTSSHAIEYV